MGEQARARLAGLWRMRAVGAFSLLLLAGSVWALVLLVRADPRPLGAYQGLGITIGFWFVRGPNGSIQTTDSLEEAERAPLGYFEGQLDLKAPEPSPLLASHRLHARIDYALRRLPPDQRPGCTRAAIERLRRPDAWNLTLAHPNRPVLSAIHSVTTSDEFERVVLSGGGLCSQSFKPAVRNNIGRLVAASVGLASLVPIALAARFEIRHRRAALWVGGPCPVCGYDVTEAAADRCPECGHVFAGVEYG